MTQQLTKNMYCESHIGPFGLYDGQTYLANRYVRNGGWYNDKGQYLGCGDLTRADLFRIANEINPDETFFVLDELEWRYINRLPNYLEIGVKVWQKARFIISRGEVREVNRLSLE